MLPTFDPGYFKKGFTLVELAIVLVIIALIIGGLLAGRSLIQASELRAIATDMQNYRTAVNTFYDKYRALPGDMPNATDYWGIAGGTTGYDSNCWTVDSSTLSNPKLTCNGNGDHEVSTLPGGTGTSATLWYWNERFRFWQHLANAGLISGSYTGVTDSASNSFTVTPGKNTPLTRIENTTFTPELVEPVLPTHPIYVDGFNYVGTYMMLRHTPGGGVAGSLTPTDAQSLDSKIDDGLPATGQMLGPKSSYLPYLGCTTTDDLNSRYNLSNDNYICHVNLFIMPNR